MAWVKHNLWGKKEKVKYILENTHYLENEKSVVVEVNAVATEQSSNVSEGRLFAIDVVGWGIIFAGSSWNIKLAVGDDIVVISFLKWGRGTETAAQLFNTRSKQPNLWVQLH